MTPRAAKLLRQVHRRHRMARTGADVAAWIVGVLVAAMLRVDFDISRLDALALTTVVVVAAILQLSAGHLIGLYRGRWRVATHEEFRILSATVILVSIGTFAAANVVQSELGRIVPRSIGLIAGPMALLTMMVVRSQWRRSADRRRRVSPDGRERTLVFGAGDGGMRIVYDMLRDKRSPYYPVAILDDRPHLRGRQVEGVPVLGGRGDLLRIARDLNAHSLLIAVPSAGSELIRTVSGLGHEAGLRVMVLPRLVELVGGTIGVGDIRDLTLADLLGRDEAILDLEAIAGYIEGKRVLVTGAGGSIGSELCRQIHNFGPAELMMLDRDESALQSVQLSIDGQGQLKSRDLILADIRDAATVDRIFAERRPDVVFHAAALKHVPMLELHPLEALKTNVLGTLNLLEAAADSGVDRFVNISTDKAADAANVLGYSKRLAERLTAHYAASTDRSFVSVRFGNVLGSRGSVLTIFEEQIARGGPVTVTDRGMTRFFMTVEEAVRLVVQAGAIGGGTEVLILDMGAAVNIDDIARRLITLSRRDIDVAYTGLRPGEKLHETLFSGDEHGVRRTHPQIWHTDVPVLSPSVVLDIDVSGPAEVTEQLRAACQQRPAAAQVA
jgi:FlaA1/EpsC-like NDP-sugar epimerase